MVACLYICMYASRCVDGGWCLYEGVRIMRSESLQVIWRGEMPLSERWHSLVVHGGTWCTDLVVGVGRLEALRQRWFEEREAAGL